MWPSPTFSVLIPIKENMLTASRCSLLDPSSSCYSSRVSSWLPLSLVVLELCWAKFYLFIFALCRSGGVLGASVFLPRGAGLPQLERPQHFVLHDKACQRLQKANGGVTGGRPLCHSWCGNFFFFFNSFDASHVLWNVLINWANKM